MNQMQMFSEADQESPLVQLISFDKLLRHYDAMAQSDDPARAHKARTILEAQAPYPELRDGFSDLTLLVKHEKVIRDIMQDTIPEVLTYNEIKTASLPFNNLVFNSSMRFQKILEDAGGKGFVPEISNLSDKDVYVMACTVVLNVYYGYKLDFRRPFFYDIPDANGVMRHYRILYNADFMEVLPVGIPKDLTQSDVDELLDNFDNLDLWKEKIPPKSFVSKGFVVSNMFDVTTEHAISSLKSGLISSHLKGDDGFVQQMQETFRSFFNLAQLRVGFAKYDAKNHRFERMEDTGKESYILGNKQTEMCRESLCPESYEKLLEENSYFAISNVDQHYGQCQEIGLYQSLKSQGIKSAIFASIAAEGKLLGVLELVSTVPYALNSVNANKLDDVMPYILSAVLRDKAEQQNRIAAVIQNECTTVHSSVYWKFVEEAKRFIADEYRGKRPSFKEIVLKDVHPLYGEVDIQNSSRLRNKAIQKDLIIQLSEIANVLQMALDSTKLPIYEELMYRVNAHLDDIMEVLMTSSEQAVSNFVREHIHPVFEHLKKTLPALAPAIEEYENKIDPEMGSYYDHRKNYDNSVMMINERLATVLDAKQEEAQAMFPHYFERYKTDGVEHNMYIGQSIAEDREYAPHYLSNLKLWQLQAMCDMENAHYKLKPDLPIPMDVTSLILVHNTSLGIRFRMDEKRFDVDGTYNVRYEVIKKRIDKSLIKGTRERLTQSGKIAIVYSQKEDEMEYLRYISFLRSKGYFTHNLEIVELEGLQGVTGLKAIRAEILYQKEQTQEKTYTYKDLMEELQN